MRNITHLVVHHTASTGPQTTVQAVNRFHRDKNWNDNPKGKPIKARESTLGWFVQYHYFIEWNGRVTQTRADWEEGWHANDANPFSIGICLAGWFDPGHDAVTTAPQRDALRILLLELSKKYKIPPQNIVPHRKFNPHKSCYGSVLPDTWAADLIRPIAPPVELTEPRIEKCRGKYAAYDAQDDEMIPITDGGVIKKLFGGYSQAEAIEVKEFSRPLSKTKKISLIQ